MLVELHGGGVTARSAGAGQGSEFIVRLPICHDQPTVQSLPRFEKPASRKIVLVEDHEDSRALMKILLETKGFTVVEASDGLSAITAIQATQPDLALVDIGLPGMDGYEVARTLRSDASLDGLVLVALTGYGRDSDVLRAKEAGFNHHLTKPVRPEVLEALLVQL
ncbi:MAG TPA: response regulator [Polyangiaceae bacterium]|jgi:CheY-like chemotaxis protein|nr:response regulator [Polyangiaceae bacterium]